MGAGILYFLALVCLGLLGLGYLVVGVLWLWRPTRAAAREVWPVLLTETIIVGSVLAAFLIDVRLFVAAMLAHAARTAYEAARITLPRAGVTTPAPAWGVAAAVVALSLLAHFLHIVPLTVLTLVAMLAAFGLRGFVTRQGLPALGLELALFPGLPLVLFTGLALQGHAVTLLVAFLLVETFDSYALLGGKLFGRRKAFPTLSPKKTVEGLVAGAAMLAATVAGVGWFLAGFPVGTAVAAALFAGMFTVAGDLAASRLKRAAGVKDFPKVLPHQGGLLDITDAWIATGAGLLALAALT